MRKKIGETVYKMPSIHFSFLSFCQHFFAFLSIWRYVYSWLYCWMLTTTGRCHLREHWITSVRDLGCSACLLLVCSWNYIAEATALKHSLEQHTFLLMCHYELSADLMSPCGEFKDCYSNVPFPSCQMIRNTRHKFQRTGSVATDNSPATEEVDFLIKVTPRSTLETWASMLWHDWSVVIILNTYCNYFLVFVCNFYNKELLWNLHCFWIRTNWSNDFCASVYVNY